MVQLQICPITTPTELYTPTVFIFFLSISKLCLFVFVFKLILLSFLFFFLFHSYSAAGTASGMSESKREVLVSLIDMASSSSRKVLAGLISMASSIPVSVWIIFMISLTANETLGPVGSLTYQNYTHGTGPDNGHG